MNKRIKVMHFVSGIGNDGVTQIIKNYTSRLNQNFNIDEIVVYQHHAARNKIKELENIGDRLYEIPYKSKHPLGNLIATYKLIKSEKPDIVHAHMSLLSFYPLVIAKLLGVKVRIAHAHIAQDNINPRLAKIFKRLNILFANHYMACGKLAGKYMFKNKRFIVLYNAINERKFKFNSIKGQKLRKKLGINKKAIVIGTLGRLTNQKNQQFLIDVFNEYNKIYANSKLVIVGIGKLKEKIIKKVAKLHQSNNVIIVSGTNNPASYYSMFNYFCLPSLYEGLPVSAIEAQASGVNTFLSNNIDKSVKYNKNVEFVSITDGTNPWLSVLKKYAPNYRCNINKFNSYNIINQYNKLYNLYINFLNGQ